METRKIQEVSGGTFTVSIPIEWAKSEDISQGTVVNLHTHIDGLLVMQVGEREEDPIGQVTVPVTDVDPEWVQQIIRAAYAAGYDEISLTTEEHFTEAQRQELRRLARNLTGVTIVSETETALTLRVLLDPEEVSIHQSIRQLKFVVLEMHRNATVAVIDDSISNRRITRCDEVDRVYALIDRSFNRALARLDEVDALGCSRPELFEHWYAVHELKRIAEHADRIMTIASQLEASIPSDQTETFETIARSTREVVEYGVRVAIEDADAELAREAVRMRNQVLTRIDSLEEDLFTRDRTDYRMVRILDSIQRTAEHSGNIAENGLRRMI